MLFAEQQLSPNYAPPIKDQPLAARLRPRNFADYVGQAHLIAPGKLLRRAIEADRFTSIILHGPPGVGKTSLAEVIANATDSAFIRLSAVGATVKDLRAAVEGADSRRRVHDERSILFIDEIHRFNRAQQDVLLPHVEHGVVRLIGATTENPYFHIVGPLVSRSQVFRLEAIEPEEIQALLHRVGTDDRAFPGRVIDFSDEALDFWANACEGDARRALTACEIAVLTTEPDSEGVIHIDLATAEESLQQKAVAYGDDGHYDTASAFIKSMRGSDPDAAIYWLAKMLAAGEDIRFIARRIVIFASEDVGNADPRALTLATSAMQACDMVGLPEARIILAQAVSYCACAPKSNAAIKAIDRAAKDVREARVKPVPVALRDSHYSGARRQGYGKDYQYPHDYPEGLAPQDYMSVDASYYEPTERGYERSIGKRLAYWRDLRRRLQESSHDDA